MILEMKHISKSFGAVQAVKDVSFSVGRERFTGCSVKMVLERLR